MCRFSFFYKFFWDSIHIVILLFIFSLSSIWSEFIKLDWKRGQIFKTNSKSSIPIISVLGSSLWLNKSNFIVTAILERKLKSINKASIFSFWLVGIYRTIIRGRLICWFYFNFTKHLKLIWFGIFENKFLRIRLNL